MINMNILQVKKLEQVYLFFTRKSFGKTNRMIEDQGEKQTKAIEKHEKQLIKSSGEKDSVNY